MDIMLLKNYFVITDIIMSYEFPSAISHVVEVLIFDYDKLLNWSGTSNLIK